MNRSSIEITKNHISSNNPTQYFNLAQHHYSLGQLGKALSYLSLGLTLNPEKVESYYFAYFLLLDNWCQDLEKAEQFENILKILEVADNIYCNSLDLNYLLSRSLYRCGRYREAWQYILKATLLNNKDPCVKYLKENITNALVERWHIPMLNDHERNQCFRKAISSCISKGYVNVLDIGAGTSILSIFARRAGAQNVVACEMDEFMCEISKEVLQNNHETAINVVNKHSKDLSVNDCAGQISLLITETFDAGLYGEHVLETLKHAWENILCLKTDSSSTDNSIEKIAKVLPSSAEIYIAIIQCDYFAKQTKLITFNDLFGTFTPIIRQDEPYFSEKLHSIPGGFILLSEWMKIDSIDFNSLNDIKDHLKVKQELFNIKCVKQGRPDAIAISFVLHLNEHSIDSFPTHVGCWENALIPINSPVLDVGHVVQVEYNCSDPISLSLKNDKISDDLETIEVNTEIFQLLNNRQFIDFYANECSKLLNRYSEQDSLIVCDLCLFPVAGIRAIKTHENCLLYVANGSVKDMLASFGVNCHVIQDLSTQIDLLFVWPLRPDGILSEDTAKLLRTIISLLKPEGFLYPNHMQLNCMTIESEELEKMVKISNKFSSGVDLQCFNLFKTTNQIGIPLDSLHYEKLSTPLSILKINLLTGQASPIFHSSDRNMQFNIYNYKVISDLNNVHEYSHNTEYLTMGGPVLEINQNIKASKSGKVSGFAYWFTLHGGTTSESGVINNYVEGSSQSCFDSNCVTEQCILINDTEKCVAAGNKYSLKCIWRDNSFNILIDDISDSS